MGDCIIRLQPRPSETNTCSADIPLDILSLILSKLFLKDHCNFKLVCKSWNLICPLWPPLPPSMDSLEFRSPCLMIPQRSNCSWKIFHSLYNNSYYLEFPELIDTEVRYSKYGWLLMSKDGFMFFFLNPFTRRKIELPPTTESFLSICFTSPPTSSDCIVFGISSIDMGDSINFIFIKVGDEEWKTKPFPFHPDLVISNCPPVVLNGVYYLFECKFRHIMRFDFTKEEFDLKSTEFDSCSEESTCEEEGQEEDEDDNCSEESTDSDEEEADEEGEEEEDGEVVPIIHESYMVEVGGDICCVIVTGNERRVSIQKLDLSGMRWNKLESLSNKCLYVSINGSFAEAGDVSGIANKIYFNRFYGRSGVMYSLSSGRYYSVGGGFASKNAYGLIEMDYGVWIKPTID